MKSIDERLDELRGSALVFAEAASEYEYLSEFKKSKLAILMKFHEARGHKTAAAQEREARSDPDYIQFLDALKTAREEYEKARWELEIAKMGAGLWQTQQATKREEMRHLGAMT